MKSIFRDIFVGVIIAAISIPIGMGYAQVSGLPAVYGLYGSVLPILVFCLISSSPEFIFGVDAAPAALIGGVLLSLNIEFGSDEAVNIIPVLTFYVAVWLLIFYIFKAERLVNYISTPVMGGFITGIGTTIILMQIPKLMGSDAGRGEFLELSEHLIESLGHINLLSLIMGIFSLAIILISKKISPKFPMTLVVMILGAMSTVIFHVDNYGVTLLSKVNNGLPKLAVPDIGSVHFKDGFMMSLPIAVVILSESLLAEINFAMKNNYKIKEKREILAFSLSNLAAALTGCCPVNGSVSRTSICNQYGTKTKLVSITASIVMAGVLMFGTEFIGYLPVPVLTAIVISALINVLEIHEAKRLYKIDKKEFFIFMGAFAAVLALGTIYGVIIGLVLSFTAMVLKSAVPSRNFMGVIPGKEGFYNLSRIKAARPISNVVIYRFNGSLFFANINTFQNDIESKINEDTKAVIIDASGIGSIDCTAADRLAIINRNFESKGIKFYITEHVGELNDEIRKLDLGYLIEKGVIRRTISTALKEAGIFPPYEIENKSEEDKKDIKSLMINEEFEWAFGSDADKYIEKHVENIIRSIRKVTDDLNPKTDMEVKSGQWGHLDIYDQDILLEHFEMHINELAEKLGQPVEKVEANIIEHRLKLAEKMKEKNNMVYEQYTEKRKEYEEMLKKNNTKLYEFVRNNRKRQYELAKTLAPEMAKDIKKLIY